MEWIEMEWVGELAGWLSGCLAQYDMVFMQPSVHELQSRTAAMFLGVGGLINMACFK